MVSVTVFTPTYNRGYAINNLYQSLLRQTSMDFEWVVIDDGSTDGTEDLFTKWNSNEKGFSINYLKTSNGGKHRAINKGLDLAVGKMFFIVDSDDFIIDTAIEIIIKKENMINNAEKYAGVAFNKGKDRNIIHGKTFNSEFVDATSLQRRKYNIIGDKAEVFYTDLLKNYKFPEFDDEVFITENVVWYRIANDGYRFRWFNKIIYICDYLNDGLSKNAENIVLNSFNGYTYHVKETLKYKISFVEKVILIGVYSRTAEIKGLTYKQISNNIEVNALFCLLSSNLSKLSRLFKIVKDKWKLKMGI